ncbi:DUF1178 family protein [Pseudokordiimonas caeni]|uniref:DUF1178 family protein n=1 Tax=Pseudokordiimonas caeni TaxID=2997908 RepID=UPI00281207EF|nr:DUF1178 family protein [Pseudokordiimonas caeni]
MIVFDLRCEQAHRFEAWFRSSGDYETQLASGLVSCPVCDSTQIEKAIMAPNVGVKGNRKAEAPVAATPSEKQQPVAHAPAAFAEMMAAFKQHVEANCEDVGENFAEEARKIHYGEAEERGIYGATSADEAQALIEEGIEVLPLPTGRRTDA